MPAAEERTVIPLATISTPAAARVATAERAVLEATAGIAFQSLTTQTAVSAARLFPHLLALW
jgi:hypothetical protein